MTYNWKNLSLKELNKNFNPRIAVPNFEEILKIENNKATKTRNKAPCHLDLRYGKGPLQILDIFARPKLKNAPVHIFIHGGYWRALDKNNHSHLAEPFLKSDSVYVSINYDLCPTVSLNNIVTEIIEAILWLYKNIENYGGNPNNLNISGHSAGAHLAAMLTTIDWKKFKINNDIFTSFTLISGIFEPQIVIKLPINKEIKITKEIANNNDLLSKTTLVKNTSILIAVGDNEPEGWINQSVKYFNYLKNKIKFIDYYKINNANHFSMISMLADNKSKITKKILKLNKLS